LSESGSAGGGVTGGGEVVVMLRIFFWNLCRSLTPALVGARAQTSSLGPVVLARPRRVLLTRVGGPKTRATRRGAQILYL